jgi:hypothetical protein
MMGHTARSAGDDTELSFESASHCVWGGGGVDGGERLDVWWWRVGSWEEQGTRGHSTRSSGFIGNWQRTIAPEMKTVESDGEEKSKREDKVAMRSTGGKLPFWAPAAHLAHLKCIIT